MGRHLSGHICPLPPTKCHQRGTGQWGSPKPMPYLHTGGHRDGRPFWARDCLVLERSGLPPQTGHRGSQVFLLPAATPVHRCPTGKRRCSDENNWGAPPPALISLGDTECFPFNYLTVNCVFPCYYYSC